MSFDYQTRLSQHRFYQYHVIELLGLDCKFFDVSSFESNEFQKITRISNKIRAKKKAENGMLEPLLPEMNPMMTKAKAVAKINNLYVRVIDWDDHFIQEPLASVLQYEAR